MTRRPSIVLVCAVAGLAACGRSTYQVEGDLVSLDADGATIVHEKVDGVMDRATDRFAAQPASILEGAQTGSRVRCDLRREGGGFVLVGIAPIGWATGTTPVTHDRGPRHGGVVVGAVGSALD